MKRYVIIMLEIATMRSNGEVRKSIFKQNEELRSNTMILIGKLYSDVFSEFLFSLTDAAQTEYKTFEQIRRILKRSINPSTTDLWEQRFTWLFSSLLHFTHITADVILAIMLF